MVEDVEFSRRESLIRGFIECRVIIIIFFFFQASEPLPVLRRDRPRTIIPFADCACAIGLRVRTTNYIGSGGTAVEPETGVYTTTNWPKQRWLVIRVRAKSSL